MRIVIESNLLIIIYWGIIIYLKLSCFIGNEDSDSCDRFLCASNCNHVITRNIIIFVLFNLVLHSIYGPVFIKLKINNSKNFVECLY